MENFRDILFQASSIHHFCQLAHGAGLAVVDHPQPFPSLQEVELALTWQTHRPCLVVKTKNPSKTSKNKQSKYA